MKSGKNIFIVWIRLDSKEPIEIMYWGCLRGIERYLLRKRDIKLVYRNRSH